jgi:CubicO group peptidase (beta-lactamase class C family)
VAEARFPGAEWTTGDLPPGTDRAALDAHLDTLFGSPGTHGATLAFVAVHGGSIVAERYGEGTGPDDTLISWSMAKSITHALVGIAVGDGLLDVSMTGLFPGWSGDARSQISLQHLLNMGSGLKWNEEYVDDTVSDVIEMLFGRDDAPHRGDHAAYAASKHLESEPGTVFEYSSGTTNLVARVLGRALGDVPPSHDAVERFMRSRLFDVTGMGTATPRFDAAGTFVGSSFVYATARDFARFGWLYANDGVWEGRRVLPGGWVDHGRAYFGTDPENGTGYGAHWWLVPSLPGSMAAFGYEGQFTFVVPDRDLVVVRLGKSPAPLGTNVRDTLVDLIRAFPEVRPPGGKSGRHG